MKFSTSLEIKEKLKFLVNSPLITPSLLEKFKMNELVSRQKLEIQGQNILNRLEDIKNDPDLSSKEKNAAKKELNSVVDQLILERFQEESLQLIDLFLSTHNKAVHISLKEKTPTKLFNELSFLAESLNEVRAKFKKLTDEDLSSGKIEQRFQKLHPLIEKGLTLSNEIEKALSLTA